MWNLGKGSCFSNTTIKGKTRKNVCSALLIFPRAAVREKVCVEKKKLKSCPQVWKSTGFIRQCAVHVISTKRSHNSNAEQ